MAFQDLNLGWVDATTEAAVAPDLLIRGFWDLGGVIQEIRQGHRFVVLGNKGTGKTAIAEHLKFLTENDPTTFASTIDLADFPYNDLRHLVDDDPNDQALPSAWSWLLFTYMLGSFGRDNGSNVTTDPVLNRLYEALDKIGLLPNSGSMKDILNLSKSSRVRLELPAGFKLNKEDTEDTDYNIPFFTEKLRTALLNFKSDNQHLFVIDGLDEVLNLTGSHLEPISGLVASAFRINAIFHKSGIPAKIILLCRTDLFDRIPGSNTNKIRQDCSIRLNWHTTKHEDSPLWKMLNLRASIQMHDNDVDVATKFFPHSIARQSSDPIRILPRERVPTKAYLLRQTRYTPRDFVALLKKIQEVQATSGQQSGITPDVIAIALKQYATEYFLPEIRNELGGYCTRKGAIEALIGAFGIIRDSRFTLKQVEDLMPREFKDEIGKMLAVLFDCSAVGHFDNSYRQFFRSFRYKDPNCQLNLRRPMLLHPALGIAFNAWDHGDPQAGEEEDPEARRRLSGTITRATPSGGLIRDDNGTTYHYNNREFKYTIEPGSPRVGRRVSFEEAPKTSPTAPYPSAHSIQVLKDS
jgi:hypothetical protein